MRDRHILVAGAGDAAASCAYCPDGSREHVAADHWPPERLAHLYVCLGLSTYGIAGLSGIDRQRVTRLLRGAGVPVRPRGAGRLRPVRRDDPPGLPRIMTEMYEAGRLSSRQIGALTGMPERTVRDRLRRYGIRGRTRGRWNREDRKTIPAGTLRDLYEQLGLTATEVGDLTGVSKDAVLRSAHALGVPVRTGGVADQPRPGRIELVRALYADDLIAAVLAAYDIPQVPPGGPIWQRFPAPIQLSAPLVKDLYWSCGAALNHIELLTGQPAMTVRGFMRREGIPLRSPAERSPFMRRWRAGAMTVQQSPVTKRRAHHDSIGCARRAGHSGSACLPPPFGPRWPTLRRGR